MGEHAVQGPEDLGPVERWDGSDGSSQGEYTSVVSSGHSAHPCCYPLMRLREDLFGSSYCQHLGGPVGEVTFL